jgi:hypothetical protein
MGGAAYLFYILLLSIGFRPIFSLIGIFIFMGSRIAIIATATPLVDSYFYFSIALLFFLLYKKPKDNTKPNLFALAFLLPIIAISKEVIIPFLFLPYLTRHKGKFVYTLSVVVSLIIVWQMRNWISHFPGRLALAADSENTLSGIIIGHASNMFFNIKMMLRPSGIHSVLNGFLFFYLIALEGFRLSIFKKVSFRLDLAILLIVPLAIFYMILSGDFGRMFFMTFPVTVPYALVCIKYYLQDANNSALK